jgi:hypothetical protein
MSETPLALPEVVCRFLGEHPPYAPAACCSVRRIAAVARARSVSSHQTLADQGIDSLGLVDLTLKRRIN